MKKITLLIASIAMIQMSCTKEKAIHQGSKDNLVLTSAGTPPVLTFATLSSYESVAEQAPGTAIPYVPAGFISLQTRLDDLEAKKEIGVQNYYGHPNIADTHFIDAGRINDVLNQDKIVNLYGNLVKVDAAKDSVYSISTTIPNAYQTLLTNTNSPSVSRYSTNEEVALKLAGANIFTCKDDWAEAKIDELDHNYCTTHFRTRKLVRYRTLGIYFTIYAKAQNERKNFWGFWVDQSGVEPLLYMNMYYKRRCSTEWGWWTGDATTWYFPAAYTGSAKHATFRPYNSIHALTKYNFGASIHGSCGVDWRQIEDNM